MSYEIIEARAGNPERRIAVNGCIRRPTGVFALILAEPYLTPTDDSSVRHRLLGENIDSPITFDAPCTPHEPYIAIAHPTTTTPFPPHTH